MIFLSSSCITNKETFLFIYFHVPITRLTKEIPHCCVGLAIGILCGGHKYLEWKINLKKKNYVPVTVMGWKGYEAMQDWRSYLTASQKYVLVVQQTLSLPHPPHSLFPKGPELLMNFVVLFLTLLTNPVSLPFFSAITFSFVALAFPMAAWFVKITSLYPFSWSSINFWTHVGYKIDHASGPCLNKDVLAKVPSKSKPAILSECWIPFDSYSNTVPFHFQAGGGLPVPWVFDSVYRECTGYFSGLQSLSTSSPESFHYSKKRQEKNSY